MGSLNKVTLIGNLGKDPELRYTKNQKPFCRFSLATTEEYTDQSGQRQKSTQWHNIVAWGKQAEVLSRYLNKGRSVYIEGRLEYREYDDQNGQRRNITDIRLDRFVFLGSGGSGGGTQGGGGGYSQAPGGGSSYGPPPEPANYGAPGPGPTQYGAPSGGESRGPATYSGSQNYGEPMDDIPDSDSFNDDDIPF